ncbi:MAG: DEAD/DEAH box helicase [Deferrisomatales bacterium]|nr:DEAD/DEAH box helicase [Deferrisomatales bacterium]
MEFTDLTFDQLSIPPELKAGIAACGFTHLTPVQARSLPPTLEGKDLAVQAQTGSGKTLAFVTTIFDRFLRTPRRPTKGVCPRAIVLTPTRELAVQVHSDAIQVGANLPFRSLAVYGGIDYRKQREDLAQGIDLLVGTPGRLIDYLKQRVYHLKDVEIAVIDEADRMFDMGFIGDIRFLLRRMSPFDKRQSLLFSATISDRVMELSYEYMNVPGLVEITPERVTAEKVEQVLYHVNSREKFRLLLGLLQAEPWEKALVFVNTKRAGNMVQERLERNGYPATVLSGDVDQARRLKIVQKFISGDVRILVATDVASRGLHVDRISHVFNYDLPQNAEDYVHRIGRTARAGASGKAVSLACEDYVYSLGEIEGYIGHKIPVEQVRDELLPAEVPRPPRSRRPDGEGEAPRTRPRARRPGGPRGRGR